MSMRSPSTKRLTRHRKSYVTISNPIYLDKFPFEIRGNQTITLHECVDFDLKIFYNEKSNKKEKNVHYNCKPCKRTTNPPTVPTTMSPNNHKGLIMAIVFIAAILLFAAVIVLCFKRFCIRIHNPLVTLDTF
ncbi:hypothetical protein NQD34_011607 [Periophthalmus magnuspinnatus]|nr:hypothetical protein NQD34_011607 [Periophthalmus magnuspinnatus]